MAMPYGIAIFIYHRMQKGCQWQAFCMTSVITQMYTFYVVLAFFISVLIVSKFVGEYGDISKTGLAQIG